jgi:hypothetical protein
MYLNDLFEGRQAPLYHFMNSEKAVDVFSMNKIIDSWGHVFNGKTIYGSSFTRNSKLNWGYSCIRLAVDQQRLASTNKIIPVDGERVHRNSPYKGDYKGPVRDRLGNYPSGERSTKNQLLSEEFVVGPINNLNRYLTEIYFYLDDMDDDYSVQIAQAVSQYAKKFSIPVVIDPKMKAAIEKAKMERNIHAAS